MLFKTLHLRLRLRLRCNYCDWRCPPLSKTIGGNADVAHSQIIGGMQLNYRGIYPPHPPPRFRHPCSTAIFFQTPNALYSKFKRLKISGKTSVRLKSGVPGWGIPLNRVLQNFELLHRYS